MLYSHQVQGSTNDLVIDIIGRSRGTIQSLLRSIQIEVYDVIPHLRDLPGEGLLFAQHTYRISLRGGELGKRIERMEPPPVIDPGKHQRFKVKLTNSGNAWLATFA